jgi:hypothetical protein
VVTHFVSLPVVHILRSVILLLIYLIYLCVCVCVCVCTSIQISCRDFKPVRLCREREGGTKKLFTGARTRSHRPCLDAKNNRCRVSQNLFTEKVKYEYIVTWPPIQWVPGHYRGYSGRGMVLTTHLLLAPRSGNSTAIPLPSLWTFGPVTGYLYLSHCHLPSISCLQQM